MYNIRQLAILSALMCLLATSAYAAQMSVEPAYREVFKGDTITVNITVDPEESTVYAASYTLHFNNTILNATLQTRGPFLTQDGLGSAVPWDVIDNLNGTVEYSEYRQGTDVGVSNPGVLATITFQVIGDEGISGLNISDYNGELLYSSSPPGSIPTDINDGSVEVSKGICGDVDGILGITMNDGRQIFMNIIHGSVEYPISNPWAADCDGLCDGMTMNDGRQIFMNIIHGPEEYPLECC